MCEKCCCHECFESRRRHKMRLRELERIKPEWNLTREKTSFLLFPRRDPKTKEWRWGSVEVIRRSYITMYMAPVPYIAWKLDEIRKM